MKRTVGSWLRRAGTAGLALLLGAAVMYADDGDTSGSPARAVRLSSVDGQVQLAQGDQTITQNAVANTPLFEGTLLTTGTDGRAEVQFEDGSVARIAPSSSMLLSVLKPGGETEVTLNSGLGYFELHGKDQDGSERVRFGSSVVTVSGITVLRVSLDQQPGEVAVFSGNAHLDGPDGLSLDLHGGESVAMNASDPSQSTVAESIEPDSWDAWNSDRDQALTTAEQESTPATNSMPDNTNPAWGDLNQNGTWYDVPDQGYVWSPYEASSPGWDPYGMGYWVYTPGFGYVWVSGEPWGYMPYQCGAWNYYSAFGWGWAPGGCQTWWGGGIFVINVVNRPTWYRLPQRPLNPRPMVRARAVGPEPIIPVNRRPVPVHTVLPPRERGTPVTIGGATVEPLRPVPLRPRYDAPGVAGKPGGGQPAAGAPSRPIYARPAPQPAPKVENNWPGSRPVATPQQWPSSRPAPSAPPRPTYTPAPRPAPPSGGGGHPMPSGGGHPAPAGGGGHSSPHSR